MGVSTKGSGEAEGPYCADSGCKVDNEADAFSASFLSYGREQEHGEHFYTVDGLQRQKYFFYIKKEQIFKVNIENCTRLQL